MAKEIKKDVEKLKEDMGKFRDDIGTSLSDLENLSHEKLIEAKENLKKSIEAFKGIASEKLEHANKFIHEKGEKAVQTSREMITQRPLTTVAVAFGAGILLALLLERGKK
jgi:ElaB/YqjD/DUF883 family membrane-anchored ribosome-binding protein